MPANEKVLAVVAEWVIKAENDLKTAAHTLKLGKDCPTDTVCFHAQQCVEKYFKACLVLEGVDFPKTHELARLTHRLPNAVRKCLTADDLDMLTEYATWARYPGWGEISLTQARRAVALARRARAVVRRLLPRQALRRRKQFQRK